MVKETVMKKLNKIANWMNTFMYVFFIVAFALLSCVKIDLTMHMMMILSVVMLMFFAAVKIFCIMFGDKKVKPKKIKWHERLETEKDALRLFCKMLTEKGDRNEKDKE